MRPRLRAVIQTEDPFDDALQLGGDLDRALAPTVVAPWGRIALQFHGKGGGHRLGGTRDDDRSPGKRRRGRRELVLARELDDPLDVRRVRAIA